MIVVAVVVCVSLTSLVAGVVWRQWVDESRTSAQNIEHLRQHEDHWQALNQNTVRIDDWRDKIVVLNFWGSWCPPCVEEMPLLDRFDSEHDQVQIVGIVVDTEEAATDFLERHAISFPSLLINQSIVTDLLQRYENADLVLPYSVAYNRSGDLFFTKAGPLNEQELLHLVE